MMARAGGSEAAEALSGAAILAVTVVSAISYAYSEQQLKKNKAYIEAINELYKLFLARSNETGVRPLPPIFSTGSDEEPTPTTCMQIDVLEDLYNIFPVYNDPHLRKYGHHVMNAMRALAKYYDWRINGRNWFWKGNKNDITSSVLSYLILMLSEHCVSFTGYVKDIYLVQNLADFINGFASLEMGMRNERFEHLTEAFNELIKAKSVLSKHSKALSMDELIAGYETEAASVSDRMVRLAAKMIAPKKHWAKVGYATMDRLKAKVIDPKYQYGRSLKHFFSSSATYLSDSLLSDWVRANAEDYVATLNVDDPELKISSHKFLPLEESNPNYQQQLKKIKAVFKASENILTLRVKGNNAANAVGKFVPVEENSKIAQRVQLFYDFSRLTNMVIVSQHLYARLWQQLKELGELYVRKSNQCDYIFEVTKGLGQQMDDLSVKLHDSVSDILAEDFAGAMQERKANLLLKDFLESIKETKKLTTTIKQIGAYHQARTKTKEDEPKKPIQMQTKDRLLSLCYEISQTYGIVTGHPVVDAADHSEAPVHDHDHLAPEKLAKMQRKKDPALGLLYAAIYEMRSYGLKLMKKDDVKGKVAVDLAEELDGMVDDFYGQYEDGDGPDRSEMITFKAVFHEKLMSKNKEMSTHRDGWLSVVGNILIALSGLGVIVLAAKALYSKLSEGSAALFFSKTNRQMTVEKVEEAVMNIATPAASAA